MSEHVPELREGLRQLLESECSGERVRATMDTADGFDTRLWSQLSAAGWASVGAGEDGGGTDPEEISAVGLEIGAALGPTLLSMTAAVCGPALGASPGAKAREYAEPAAAGKVRVTPVLTADDGCPDPDRLGFRAEADGKNIALSGVTDYVLDAHVADVLLVAVAAQHDVAVYAVPAGAAAVSTRRVIDPTRRLCRVELDRVPVDAEWLVADSLDGYLTMVGGALLALCAEATGGLSRLLRRTVEYVSIREQFGRPIGSFQIIKHRLANMYVATQECDAALALAMDAYTRCDLAELGCAKAQICESMSVAARDALQTHGGIGYTWEHDAHLFLKRAELNAALFGSSRWHRLRAFPHIAAFTGQETSRVG